MSQLVEFTNQHLLLTGGLVASLFLVLYTEFRLRANAGVELTPVDAVRRLNDNAVVLDIRPAEQFARGHIAGARNLTPDQVTASEDRMSDLEGRDVIVACQSGIQCGRVVSSLRGKGYDRVFSLKGGIAAWEQDKLPLVADRKGKPKNKSKSKGRK